MATFTIKQIATIMQKHPLTIRRFILEGRLIGKKCYDHRCAPYIVEESDLEAFKLEYAKSKIKPETTPPAPIQAESVPEVQPIAETPVMPPVDPNGVPVEMPTTPQNIPTQPQL